MRARRARRLENSRSLGKGGIPDPMISALVVSLILGAKIGKVLWFDRSSIGILEVSVA
jgi:hypothetical protein